MSAKTGETRVSQSKRSLHALARKFSQKLTLLRAAEESAVFLETKVYFNEVCTCEELHDHARGDDGCNAEFHECPSIRGKDDTSPVEGV